LLNFWRVAVELKRKDGGAISTPGTAPEKFLFFSLFSAILARTNLVKRFKAG